MRQTVKLLVVLCWVGLGPNFPTCSGLGWVGLGQTADELGWIGSHKMDPWTALWCVRDAEFPADSRHVFSRGSSDYYHSLFVDSLHHDSILLAAASVSAY